MAPETDGGPLRPASVLASGSGGSSSREFAAKCDAMKPRMESHFPNSDVELVAALYLL
jgi:hypothetical protein